MLAFDTETTGLQLLNGCTTFSIGIYDGERFRHSTVPVNPETRQREREHPASLRKTFDAADLLVAHNAQFDIKALCEAGIYNWQEPNSPEFWNRILDTSSLGHLYCSTDTLTLDYLTLKYLGKKYDEEKQLVTAVNKCRDFARRYRKTWAIAEKDGDHESFQAVGRSTQWNRMDYWLPAAIHRLVPSHQRPGIPDSRIKDVLLTYLKADCVNTYELAQFYFHELTSRHGDELEDLLRINKQVEHVIWKMETTGLYVRPVETRAAIDACEKYISILTEKVQQLSGIEDLTPNRLRVLLFNEWRLPPVQKTPGGGYSVNAATILKLHGDAIPGSKAHTFLCCYLALQKYTKKLQSLRSYYNSRNKSGLLYSSFNSTGTRTTRFSARNPNTQNVTKAGNPYEDDAPDIAHWLRASPSMRSCFGPRPGYWWLSADYSQLQLRIFAHITNEQEMIDAFARGWDAHDFVARRIFQIRDSDSPTKAQRRVAKNVNFAFIFGASPKKLERTAGIPGLWDTVTQLFPNAHAFIEETKKTINQSGKVYTLGGYPLELKDYINKYTGRLEKAAHAGVNYLVQGAEGIIAKDAMYLCDRYFSEHYPEGRIALQVHDELDFEVPVRIPKYHVRKLKEQMELAASRYGILAPVEISLITTRWDKETRIAL